MNHLNRIVKHTKKIIKSLKVLVQIVLETDETLKTEKNVNKPFFFSVNSYPKKNTALLQ